MSRFRLLYINDALLNYGPGPAVHGRHLIRELRDQGVDLIVFPDPSSNGRSPPNTLARQHEALHRRVRDRFYPESWRLLMGLKRTLTRTSRIWNQRDRLRPDVILARQASYDWTPWIAARMLGCPLVLEVNAPKYVEKILSGGKRPMVLQRMEELQWRRATYIHAVSKELSAIIRASGVPSDRIICIPNGADPWAFDFGKADKVEGEPTRIIFVGAFYRWHGVEDLVEAAALVLGDVPDAKFLFVGSGPESDNIQQQVVQRGIGHAVEMPGRVPHEVVQRYLRGVDIAVAPYPQIDHCYFSPLKLFEYMAAARAIVASKQGQIAEVLEHGRTALLYSPGNVRELANSILHLIRNPGLRRRMGAAAREELIANYTWTHTAERILELCRAAAREPSPEARSRDSSQGPAKTEAYPGCSPSSLT